MISVSREIGSANKKMISKSPFVHSLVPLMQTVMMALTKLHQGLPLTDAASHMTKQDVTSCLGFVILALIPKSPTTSINPVMMPLSSAMPSKCAMENIALPQVVKKTANVLMIGKFV